MKTKKIFYLLVLFSVIFISCKKDTKETKVDIQYKMLDDVSPVKISLKVDKELYSSDWNIDGIEYQQTDGNDNNKLDVVFNNPGLSNVEFNGYGKSGKFIGKINIEIPPVANKLNLNGYFFNENLNLNITDNELIFKFDYYNGNTYTYYNTTVLASDFISNNSFLFSNPIVIDISDFENKPYDDVVLFFKIVGKETNKNYFTSMMYVKTWYYAERLMFPDPNRISFENSGNEHMNLYCDWTR